MCLFRSCGIEYVQRDANPVAHNLAKEAIKHVIDNVWIEKTQNCIYSIVIREQTTPG